MPSYLIECGLSLFLQIICSFLGNAITLRFFSQSLFPQSWNQSSSSLHLFQISKIWFKMLILAVDRLRWWVPGAAKLPLQAVWWWSNARRMRLAFRSLPGVQTHTSASLTWFLLSKCPVLSSGTCLRWHLFFVSASHLSFLLLVTTTDFLYLPSLSLWVLEGSAPDCWGKGSHMTQTWPWICSFLSWFLWCFLPLNLKLWWCQPRVPC